MFNREGGTYAILTVSNIELSDFNFEVTLKNFGW